MKKYLTYLFPIAAIFFAIPFASVAHAAEPTMSATVSGSSTLSTTITDGDKVTINYTASYKYITKDMFIECLNPGDVLYHAPKEGNGVPNSGEFTKSPSKSTTYTVYCRIMNDLTWPKENTEVAWNKIDITVNVNQKPSVLADIYDGMVDFVNTDVTAAAKAKVEELQQEYELNMTVLEAGSAGGTVAAGLGRGFMALGEAVLSIGARAVTKGALSVVALYQAGELVADAQQTEPEPGFNSLNYYPELGQMKISWFVNHLGDNNYGSIECYGTSDSKTPNEYVFSGSNLISRNNDTWFEKLNGTSGLSYVPVDCNKNSYTYKVSCKWTKDVRNKTINIFGYLTSFGLSTSTALEDNLDYGYDEKIRAVAIPAEVQAECGNTHFSCNYTKKACEVVDGAGENECAKYEDCVCTPSATLTADPSTISKNSSTTTCAPAGSSVTAKTGNSSSVLSWNIKNCGDSAYTCTASSGWSGKKTGTGSTTVSPIVETTYMLTCGYAGGKTTVYPATVSVGKSLPVGELTSVDTSACTISGWAYDADVPTTAVSIHAYVDAPAGAGSPVMAFSADKTRSDLSCANKNHGFENVTLPSSLRDGKSHKLYLYPVDNSVATGGSGKGSPSNPLTGANPKTFTCNSTDPEPVTDPFVLIRAE
jgi:hypothetical protein